MLERFSVISNHAVTTPIAVDYSRKDFFLRQSSNLNKLPSLQVDLKTTLKLVSAIFYQIFIFSPNYSPLKTMKNVFYFI